MTNTQLLNALPAPLARKYLLAALWQHYITTHGTRHNAAKALAKQHQQLINEVL